MNDTLYVGIEGIYCQHCVETITKTLSALDGVEAVSIRQNTARITGQNLPDADTIIAAIRRIGYETDESKISRDRPKTAVRWYELLLIAAVVLLAVFGVNRLFGYNVFNAIPTVDSSLSYGMLFVTGLLTSIHCITMCGALGIYASSETNSVRSMKRPLLYNTGRVLSYTLIGGVIGLASSVFSVSGTLRGIVILLAAVLMLLMALSMLGYIQFRLPRLFRLRIGGGHLGAFVIGLLNGLMPCGPLQALQLYALSAGGFLPGALAMLMFALGTVPLMLLSGAAINLTKGRTRLIIGKAAPVLMLILALSMANRGLLTLGVDVTDSLPSRYGGYVVSSLEDGVQTAEFDLDYDSYADIVVQRGVPTRLVIHADENKLTGCNNRVVSREFGFDVTLTAGDNVIEFTPEREGEYVYTCWMNMIKNHIRVVENLE